MCGILAIFGLRSADAAQQFRPEAIDLARCLRHRGPDWSGCEVWDNHIIAHERLAIVGVDSGAQPIVDAEQTTALAVNGEIYNYKSLGRMCETRDQFLTDSDCESLLHLYKQFGTSFLEKITVDGMYAFVIYDKEKDIYMAARDPVGIIPLYIGWSKDGSVWFSSEMKALTKHCERYQQFPCGHYYASDSHEMKKFFTPRWHEDIDYIPEDYVGYEQLRIAFEKAVKSHMMSDVPYGVLLSGGLDSSLVAAVAGKIVGLKQHRRLSVDMTFPFWGLQSYCIGLEGSPDLEAARKVADFIGTKHHSWTFTIQEGIDALSEVIRHIETCDVTTVRASTPMYLLSRKIKATSSKMVLSGEGADEIFGGYLYFHKAPNREEFHRETVRKVKDLHMYDCLRANKAMMAWGVEVRVPFLDRAFLDMAMNTDPSYKMVTNNEEKIEKYILRKAFDVKDAQGNPMYLPPEILWRQKEQFSDGVGYGWIDSLKDYSEEKISDQQMKTAKYRFPIATPQSKEAYLFREIFNTHFPGESAAKTLPTGASIACSTSAAVDWDESFKGQADPSGRAVSGIHSDAYNEAGGTKEEVLPDMK